MHDIKNGAYKIGRSKYPTIREKTLQSEKPYIELVATWECEPRLERKLHIHFSNKRIRGEWFTLTLEDINYIHEYMDNL